MKLTEILHTIEDEKKSNLINIDEWKFSDAEHLKDMGFELEGDYYMRMENPPITIYKQKLEKTQEAIGIPQQSVYVIDEPKRGKKAFNKFDGVIEYFDSYKQPELKPGMEDED